MKAENVVSIVNGWHLIIYLICMILIYTMILYELPQQISHEKAMKIIRHSTYLYLSVREVIH